MATLAGAAVWWRRRVRLVLNFELSWYRRLLATAAVLGVAGGVFGLLYLGATWAAIDHCSVVRALPGGPANGGGSR